MNYFMDISENLTSDEVYYWLIDNIGEYNIEWKVIKYIPASTIMKPSYSIEFKHEESVVAFKLRWI